MFHELLVLSEAATFINENDVMDLERPIVPSFHSKGGFEGIVREMNTVPMEHRRFE